MAAAAAAVAAVGGRKVGGRQYPNQPGLPIRRMCGKVQRNLSDSIGLIAATYAPLSAGCSVWNLSIYLSVSIYLSILVREGSCSRAFFKDMKLPRVYSHIKKLKEGGTL